MTKHCAKSALAAACAFIALVSCAKPSNVREAMFASIQRDYPDFPDGKDTLCVRFAHIGECRTAEGKILYVADVGCVVNTMLSPRGFNYIAVFDGAFRFLGKIDYVQSKPLFCEGSKLYLWGELDIDYATQTGNVVDFSGGFENPDIRNEFKYGSSGGLDYGIK